MLLTKIDAAEAEAKRFLQRVKALKAKVHNNQIALDAGCRESGAVRLASMDLNQALIDMRKS